MKKIILTSLLTAIAMGATGVANAEVFTYEIEGNRGSSRGGGETILTIDTTTGTGSVVGGNINASFEGDFSSFSGGETPDLGKFDLTNLTGTRIVNGETFNVADVASSPHPFRLITDGEGGVNLWAFWGENEHGDYLADTVGYTPPTPTSSSTSTGGLDPSSSGGSTSSTSSGGSSSGGSTGGGTDVPAPGALLLLGLGAAGLAFGNRRRKNKVSPTS